MWYITAIVVFIYLISLPNAYCQITNDLVEDDHTKNKQHVQRRLYAQSETILNTQNDETITSKPEELDSSSKNEKYKTAEERSSTKESKEPPPLKNFVPSEQIEVGKTVDFPVDI